MQVHCELMLYLLNNITLSRCCFVFDRACPHAETGVPGTAPPPEHVAPGVGLWSIGHQCRGNVHQTDGSTICKGLY